MSVFIFDLDGTIADSNRAWDKIDRELIRKHGADIPEEVAASMAAMPYKELFDTLSMYGICYKDVRELQEEIDAIAEREYALNIKLKPGAEQFLRLSAEKHRTVLFTASPSRLYAPLLEHYGIYGCFSDIVCSEDIDADKKTDGYTKLAVFLGISPSDCVVFEDSFLCAQSAKAAGMCVICVYDEFSSKLPGYENIKAISERVITDFGSEYDII